jgi:hypothetical protein
MERIIHSSIDTSRRPPRMADIKPQLMSDAHAIVRQHRSSGGDLNELVAKHANEKSYNDLVTQNLVCLVNRHGFKMAMEHERKDEPVLADAAVVKLARHRLANGSAEPVKSASLAVPLVSQRARDLNLGSFSTTTKSAAFVMTPGLIAHLNTGRLTAESGIKQANAELRRVLERMQGDAKRLKTLGVEKQAVWQQMLADAGEELASVIEPVMDKTAAVQAFHTRKDLEMLVPAALGNFERMKRDAAHAVKVAGILSQLQTELAAIKQDLETAKQGV